MTGGGGSPRRNRVDPWSDLHAHSGRGLFTGNRGCVVDEHERVVRHHGSQLWIICRTEFRGRRFPLARPRRWTPLFFLDDAVALAAGHRPCATCRRADYRAYQRAVTDGTGAQRTLLARELNARLHRERHRPGRGLIRGQDRILTSMGHAELPDGAVVIDDQDDPRVIVGDTWLRFSFDGWTDPQQRPTTGPARVLTPPTSIAALAHGYAPVMHPSAHETGQRRWPSPPATSTAGANAVAGGEFDPLQ